MGRLGRIRLAVVVAAVIAFTLIGAASASARPSFSQVTPAPDTTTTLASPTISVFVTDTVMISRATLTIDGLYYGLPTLVPTIVNGVRDYTRVTVVLPVSNLSDGPHVAYLSVYPKGALYATYSWVFRVGSPPAFTAPSPAPNATVTDAMSAVSIGLTDNVGVASYSLSIGGTPVPATLSGGRLSFAPGYLLPVDTAVTASAAATDVAGDGSSQTWSFRIHPTASFASKSPAPGSAASPLAAIAVHVSDTAAINSVQLLVDGVAVTPSVTGGGTTEVTVSFTPSAGLSDGDHSVIARTTNARGETDSDKWTFSVGGAPILWSPTPAGGTTVVTLTPAISAVVVGATPLTGSSASVNGEAAITSYDPITGTILVFPAGPLPDGSDIPVTVTASGSTGAASTLSWTFHTDVPKTDFSSLTPSADATVTSAAPPVSVAVSSSVDLNGASLTVDGVTVPSTFAFGADHRHATVSGTLPALHDGQHTVVVSTSNVVGTAATRTWRFGVSARPVLTSPLPAASSIVATTFPAISIKAEDNDPFAEVRLVVNGYDMVTEYDAAAKTLRVEPPVEWTDDSTVTVSAIVTDQTGNTSSADWAFHIETLPDMPNTACTDCHTTFPAAHPYAAAGCNSCHYSDIVNRIPGCSAFNDEHACHSYSPPHPRTPLSSFHTTDVTSCKPCHVSSLTIEHFRRHDSAGETLTCTACHGPNASATVKAAVSSGSTACTSCHAASLDSGGSHVQIHDSAVAHENLNTTGKVCEDCHDANLLAEHARPTSSSGAGCAACHPSPRNTITAAWGGTCTEGGCHQQATRTALHGSIDASHSVTATYGCLNGDCHAGSDLASIHVGASKTVDGATKTSCSVCHSASSVPNSRDCASCHDTAAPHGNVDTLHSPTDSASTACAGCHKSANALTIHAGRIEGRCRVCHDNPTKGDLTAGKTSARCAGCHTSDGSDFHQQRDAKHLSPTTSTCFGAGCHDSSKSLPAVHDRYVGTGARFSAYDTSCQLCHQNADANRIDWSKATAQCTGVCHSTSTHSQYNTKHTVTSASAECTVCHGTNITSIHGASDLTRCGVCHADKTNWSKTADCSSCHAALSPVVPNHSTGTDATHTASLAIAGYTGGADNVASGGVACSACHSAKLLTVHTNTSSSLHGGSLTCADCHTDTTLTSNAVVASGWSSNKCTACHNANGHTTHNTFDSGHTATSTAGCTNSGSGCHGSNTDLRAIHANKGCSISGCHDSPDKKMTGSPKSCGAGGGCHATYSGNHYPAAQHTSTAPAATFTVSGTSYGPYACSSCHSTDLSAEHAKASASTSAAGCSACHPSPKSSLTGGWNPATCAQGDCHAGTSPDPQHGQIDAAHAAPANSCTDIGCHGGKNLAALHSNATTTVAGVEKTSCFVCHSTSAILAKDCTTCHGTSPHPDLTPLHASTGGIDYEYATHGDSEYLACSDCHIQALLTLHLSDCARCHADSAPAAVKTAVANNQTACTACHASQHIDPVQTHEDMYNSGDMNCGDCHGSGCVTCHGPTTPVADPATTSDVIASYIGGARITLSPSDGANGPVGIRATYYTLDGGAARTGTTIIVPAPPAGSASHTITFWSTDFSGKTETPHSASFTVVRDTTPPVTTSDAKASYGGTATITFTATDDSRDFGVAGTVYSLDGGAVTTATGAAVVPRSPSGTIHHSLQFRSVDQAGNWESTKTVEFDITHDSAAPVTTSGVPIFTRSQYNYWSFPAVDADPSSGLQGTYVTTNDPSLAIYGPYGSPGAIGYSLYATTQGTHWYTYWSADKEGNIEPSRTATYTSDWTAPSTTSDAGSSYIGTATINLTASDAYSGVANTYWRTYRAGAYSSWTTGTPAKIAPPASGSQLVYFYYYSTDKAGNSGSQNSRQFTMYASVTPTYTLSYSAGPGGGLMGTTTQVVPQGGSGTQVSAIPNTGYHFVSWSDGYLTSYRTDTNVQANKSLTANFAADYYTLTYTAGTGGSISGSSTQNVAPNGSGTAVTAVPNTGYRFVSWSDGLLTATRTDTNVQANKSLTANFAPNISTLTYTAGANGSLTGTTTQSVAYGSSGTSVTAVPNTGYHFVNWSDGSTTNPRTDTNVTGNISVTANFAINTYTLTYTAGANGTISGASPQTVSYNASGSAVTAVGNTGYHFVNWSDGSTANPRTDTSVTANKSVTANFGPDGGYTITASAGPGGSISPAGAIQVDAGTSSTFTITPNTGYLISQVVVDGVNQGAIGSYTFASVSGPHTISATFAIQTFQIYSYANPGGIVSPSGYRYPAYGTTETYTVTANTNYRIAALWRDYDYVNGYMLPSNSASSTYSFTNITAGHYLYAYFGGTNTRALVYTYGVNGYTSPYGPQSVSIGATGPVVTAYPNGGYHFVNWSDGSTANPRQDTNVQADKIITPVFAPNLYAFNYTAGANGSISGEASQSVAYGTSSSAVTAVPDAGYRFISWSDGNINATRTDPSTGDFSVSAIFAPSSYHRVSYYVNGPGSITGSTIQAVADGGSATPVDVSFDAAWYQFDGWSDGATSGPRQEVNVTSDLSLTANFSQWNFPSSCPILYTWDGAAFKFESDLIPAGRLGSSTWNSNDYYVLETTPKAGSDGKLQAKLVNEAVETDYMDQMKLYAIDLPEGSSLASFQMLKGAGFAPLEAVVKTVSSQLTAPRAVHVEDGADISAEVAANHDGRSAILNPDREQPAVQTVELDLGQLPETAPVKLLVEGASWTPDTSSGQALYNAIPANMRTAVEVMGAGGTWQVLPGAWPKPGEFQRSYLLDLTGKFPTSDRRVRLVFSVKTALDSILLDTTPDQAYTATEVPLSTADQAHHGADAVTGLVPDFTYGIVNPLDKYLTGYYTKFGDVTPLLTGADDKFVIMGSGDELTLKWDALAPPAEGKTRYYVVYADGYYKFLKRGLAPAVDPLPFAAMSSYPYPSTEHYPDDADHQQYRDDWNTRYENGF